MKLTVLYFAVARDLAGRDEEVVDVPATVVDIASFARWIETHHAALEGRMASIRLARNEAFAKGDERVSEGDVIALIPPVSGGLLEIGACSAMSPRWESGGYRARLCATSSRQASGALGRREEPHPFR